MCPNGALEMRVLQGLWLPKVTPKKCTSCGLCAKVCPGYSVDFELLNAEVFGRQPVESSIGNYINCYVGYSNEKDLRFNSSSGGLASHILIYALEHGLIDGALVTRMSKSRPLEPETFVAHTKDQIIEASKSKYCPVAANSALRQIMAENGKFAVVGLPCHLHGVRKAENLNPNLKKKIVLHIGLMCSHMVSFTGTEFIVKKMRFNKEDVTGISYRGRGWPGALTIKSKDTSSTMPLVGNWNSYWPVFSGFLFTPTRCTMCPDQTAELSDISLGDAWLPELRRDHIGQSILITRTQFAEDILNRMKSTNEISLLPVRPEKIGQSQAVNLRFKKDDFSTRLALLNALGKQLPVFFPSFPRRFSLLALLRASYIFLSIKVSMNKYLRSVLVHFPFPLFRAYSGIYRKLSGL
jgi:coenzyme F420 hydrogenase subunit beta